MRHPRPLVATLLAVAMSLAACGSSGSASSSTTRPTSSGKEAVDPNAPEVVAPGDIPDNQVFVAYSPPGAPFSLRVPEGWSRSTKNDVVTFTDKFNSIEIRPAVSEAPPTVATVRTSVAKDHAKDPTFELGKVTTVDRSSGSGILATYLIGSAPNSVTGKSALLAVEHYEFSHNGMTAVLNLSGAKGADNVDPWRAVTDSLTWR